MERDCREVHCTEDYCTEGHCIEDRCAEAKCTEENDCGTEERNKTYVSSEQNSFEEEIEEEPADVSLFIMKMSFCLIQGMVTEKDIYEGMIEANCGNKEVARYITNRAVEEARIYLNSLQQETETN